MAETSRNSNGIGIAAIGGVSAMTGIALQVKPEDAVSNLSLWLHFFGVDRVPNFLATTQADTWGTAIGLAIATTSFIFLFVRWRKPRPDREFGILDARVSANATSPQPPPPSPYVSPPFALKPMETNMSDIIWHDKDSPPDSPRMVIAEYREWNVASNPPREHIVQWLEGSWRSYGQMDSRAYVDRWREVPGADEITTLRARIVELEASIADMASETGWMASALASNVIADEREDAARAMLDAIAAQQPTTHINAETEYDRGRFCAVMDYRASMRDIDPKQFRSKPCTPPNN
jgi:hypothetical protein